MFYGPLEFEIIENLHMRTVQVERRPTPSFSPLVNRKRKDD